MIYKHREFPDKTIRLWQSGISKQYVGRALRDFAKRDEVVVAAKFLPRTPEAIDVKTKCIITAVSLMASGITDSSLTCHLQNAKAL